MMLDPQRGADESPADYEARVHALSTLPFQVTTEDDKDGGYTFEVRNDDGSKFDGQRRWVRAWLHQALDQHVMAIHREYPLSEVMIGNGTRELPHDWTTPIEAQEWWWTEA